MRKYLRGPKRPDVTLYGLCECNSRAPPSGCLSELHDGGQDDTQITKGKNDSGMVCVALALVRNVLTAQFVHNLPSTHRCQHGFH